MVKPLTQLACGGEMLVSERFAPRASIHKCHRREHGVDRELQR